MSTTIDGQKTRVSMDGTLPSEIEGAEHISTLRAGGRGRRTWYRALYYVEQGYVVYDYAYHDRMPDATVGWLKGYMDRETVGREHAEFSEALTARDDAKGGEE
jgi:hypothetical protein